MPLTPGTRLGPYEVLALVATGGMGEVYRVFDTHLGREVAVKGPLAPIARAVRAGAARDARRARY